LVRGANFDGSRGFQPTVGSSPSPRAAERRLRRIAAELEREIAQCQERRAWTVGCPERMDLPARLIRLVTSAATSARLAQATGWFGRPMRVAAEVRRRVWTIRMPMWSSNSNWWRIRGGLGLVWKPLAADPPRYLGGYQRQVCAGNGMARPPNAGSRRGQEADLDHSYAYAVRKSQMAAGFGPIGPGLDFARGGFPRPAGGERDRVGGACCHLRRSEKLKNLPG
jgi:hypothetical protein